MPSTAPVGAVLDARPNPPAGRLRRPLRDVPQVGAARPAGCAPETLSLADLLLTKLQVVETNRKDVVDIATLLSDHPLTQDESGINMGYIASLAASDWPWWRTISMVAERVSLFARDQGLAAGSRRSDPGQRPAGDARAGAEVGPVENAPALATANNGTRSPKRTFENRV